uniref:Scavenger receptor class F member 2 n=1 Tax=Magallana gigas TaxID=29159 RepID=K1QEB2_MAGGI
MSNNISTACNTGSYGIDCKEKCGNCLDVYKCSLSNGTCLTGCVAGCSPKGYFGSNCSIPCPDVNCQECHMESGICHVCKQGYKGQRCETDFINNIKFYSLLGAFCLSLTVIGILIGYNIMIRKRQLTQHQPYDHQESCDVNLPDVSRGYVNCEELRDMQIYDTAQTPLCRRPIVISLSVYSSVRDLLSEEYLPLRLIRLILHPQSAFG